MVNQVFLIGSLAVDALLLALFGVKPGHCAEGAWMAEASDVMRRRPDYLTKFHADRALVEKARLCPPAARRHPAPAPRRVPACPARHAPCSLRVALPAWAVRF